MSQPFLGITVLDLTQIYNGPYATFLMAQGGADVIKIEPPGGEHLRKRQGASGAAMPFAMLNANKRTMTLDLKSAEGHDVLLRLVAEADVLVENFAPGVMERLGLAEAVLRAGQPAARLRVQLRLRQDGPVPRLPGDGPHRAGDDGRHRHHRLPGPPAGEGRPGDGRLPGRHPPVRRHGRRAVRARAHRRGPDGRGLDDGGGVPHAGVQPRPVLRLRGQGAAAHRQPAHRHVAVPVQRLSDHGRLAGHHHEQRPALELAGGGARLPRARRRPAAADGQGPLRPHGRGRRGHRRGHRAATTRPSCSTC